MVAVPQETIAPTVSADDLKALQSVVGRFDREQLIWTSGFLAGLAGNTAPHPMETFAAESAAPVSWTIFYATETGNSRRVAEQLAERSRAAGMRVDVQDLQSFRPRGLTKIDTAIFVLATHGIGEPPEGSEAFFEHWFSDKAARLEHLEYSVLALGDSSYADFCEIGRRFDARLAELGATAVVPRVDCDLDFETPAAQWSREVLEYSEKNAVNHGRVPTLHAVPSTTAIDRHTPFSAEILTNQKISGSGSSKDVRHIELDLEGAGLQYQPGDSIAVVAQNPPQLVEALLDRMRFDGTQQVLIGQRESALYDALRTEKEVTQLSRPILDAIATEHSSMGEILAHRERFADYLSTRQLIDLIHEFPIDWEPQAFVDSLRRLAPRLYSIASSPDVNPDEAHLTVGVLDYEAYGRRHWGAASTFLTGTASHAPVYVEANQKFRLPDSGDTPIIMVGAGTGVAPYRAFIEHRREHGHRGDNWLIFGDRNFATDFLYQLEWLRYRKDGILTRLDVAFSRDQANKIYVQHRLRENAIRLFGWLDRGAHLYVCGDAEHMAPDVHQALLDVVAKGGGMNDERAAEYVADMKQNRRYLRDVY